MPTDSPAVHIAGVDEAGRGPLAGPLVVAAVILDPARPISGIRDSKQLSERKREQLFDLITRDALSFAIVSVEPDEIDRLNIFQATMAGMCQALRELTVAPDSARIDGNSLPKDLPCPAEAWVGGDARCSAIGAASILAKVTRDQRMMAMDREYPQYGFAKHKGYPTAAHLQALRAFGICPQHRLSYAPVRAAATQGKLW
ncbi:MAG TPA: ribonuclease HII [Aquimonas sp.]|nr:ribonuclease HII [Aquimonas sp.]HRF52970.1 ribonuclease HII [Aquimonas sp.]